MALLAAAIVASVTIDLGPAVRAPRRGRRLRSTSSGRCTSARSASTCSPAASCVEDLRIDGLHPGDRPFFTASSIEVALDWLPALQPASPKSRSRSVEMTDWQMLVEKWEDAPQLPEVQPRRRQAAGAEALDDDAEVPARVARPVRLRGSRDAVERDRAATSTSPSATCRSITARATFNGGTVTIQDFVPMWANMKAQFVIDGPRIHLDRIDIDTDGATTVAQRRRRHGALAEAGLPGEVARQVPAHARAVLQGRAVAARPATATSPARSTCSRGEETNRDLTGTFASELAGVERLPVSRRSTARCAGRSTASTSGTPARSSTAATRRFVYGIKPFGAEDEADASLRRDAHRRRSRARSPTSSSFRGLRFAGTRVAAQRPRVAVGPFLRASRRRAQLVDRAAARRRRR